MIGVEFGPPQIRCALKASWNVLETANKGPVSASSSPCRCFKDHKILTQVAGHGSHTIKLLPPLTITEEDCRWIEAAFDSVIASSHKVARRDLGHSARRWSITRSANRRDLPGRALALGAQLRTNRLSRQRVGAPVSPGRCWLLVLTMRERATPPYCPASPPRTCRTNSASSSAPRSLTAPEIQAAIASSAGN